MHVVSKFPFVVGEQGIAHCANSEYFYEGVKPGLWEVKVLACREDPEHGYILDVETADTRLPLYSRGVRIHPFPRQQNIIIVYPMWVKPLTDLIEDKERKLRTSHAMIGALKAAFMSDEIQQLRTDVKTLMDRFKGG